MKRKFHYAWVSLTAAWLAFMGVGLIRYVYPYVVPQMQTALGISHIVMATIISTFFWLDMVMRIVWGAVMDKYGTRSVTLVGLLLLASGFFVMSQAKRVLILALGFAITGTGAAALFILPAPLLSRWFGQQRRAFAIGVATTSAALVRVMAGFIIPRILITRPYNNVWGFGAVLALFILLFQLVFLVESPEEKGLNPHGALNSDFVGPEEYIQGSMWSRTSVTNILTSKVFYQIGISYFLFGCAYTGVQTFFVGYFLEMGWDPAIASRLVAFSGVGSLLSGPLWGMAGARFARRNVYSLGMVVLGASILLLILGNQVQLLTYLATMLFGIGGSGATIMNSAIQADYFDKGILGTSFGFCAACFSIASAISPIIGGALADYTGTLQAVMIIGLITSISGAITILTLAPPQSGKGILIGSLDA